MITTSSNRVRTLCAPALLAAALTFTAGVRPARAQRQDEAASRALFNEARKLQKAGHLDEACFKFEAAAKIYQSPGVLLNLADCHEHQHKTATAWTEFGDAATAAMNASRPKDAAEARRRQEALEPQLSRLEVLVHDPAPAQVVRRDGLPVAPAAWGTAIPVDPGAHTIQSEAEGRLPFSTTVNVEEPGRTVSAEVPKLNLAPRPAAPSASPAWKPSAAPAASLESAPAGNGSPAPGRTQRVVGLVVGGVGIAGVGAAGVLALMAKSRFDTATTESTNKGADSRSAVKMADAATVTVAAGAALAVAGTVFWLTAPKAHVAVGTTGRGLFVAGSFP